MDQITKNLSWAIDELKRKKLIGGYETIDIDLRLGDKAIYNIISGRNKNNYDLSSISFYIYRKDPEVCQQMWRYISGINNLHITPKKMPDELPQKVRIILSQIFEKLDNLFKEIIKLSLEIYKKEDE